MIKRMGIYRMQGAHLMRRTTWQCSDGHINFWLSGGTSGATSVRSLLAWMDADGMKSEELENVSWEELL